MESNDKLEELLQQMYAVEETPIDVDKEWRKFEAKHFKRQHPLLRVAAIFIGILMLSGITYAAIHLMRYISRKHRFGGFSYYCWVIGVLSVILYLIF